MTNDYKRRTARSANAKPFQVPESLRAELLRKGRVRNYPAGTIVFSRGKPSTGVYLVVTGRVALSAGEDPVRITRIAECGSLLGLPATVRNQSYSLTAEAVTDVELCRVGPSVFRAFLQKNPEQCFVVLQMVADELSAIREIAVYQA